MARSSNMSIPELTFYEGIRELQDRIDILNAGSAGTITVNYDPGFLAANGGDYRIPVKFARTSGIVSHVDEADPATADTAVTMSTAKGATVFQSLRAYIQRTRDEMMRGKATPAAWAVNIAQQMAESKLVYLRDNLLAMAVAAIDSMDTPSANYHVIDDARGSVGGSKVKFTFARLNLLLNKMGDAREKIKSVVLHSSVFADLMADGITNYKIDNVGGMMIASDIPQAMGRKLIVVDSTSLYSDLDSSYYSEYYVLGLAEGALQATIISEDPVEEETVLTTKVKTYRTRQDLDVEYGVQGMKWVTGTINPTDAELATAASWDEDLSDHRECGIVKGIYNAT